MKINKLFFIIKFVIKQPHLLFEYYIQMLHREGPLCPFHGLLTPASGAFVRASSKGFIRESIMIISDFARLIWRGC